VEADALDRLAAIRKAITGEVRDAGRDLEAVRTALKHLFESFTVSIPKDGRGEIPPRRRIPDGYEPHPDWNVEDASGELLAPRST
jgi:hypothetical protein